MNTRPKHGPFAVTMAKLIAALMLLMEPLDAWSQSEEALQLLWGKLESSPTLSRGSRRGIAEQIHENIIKNQGKLNPYIESHFLAVLAGLHAQEAGTRLAVVKLLVDSKQKNASWVDTPRSEILWKILYNSLSSHTLYDEQLLIECARLLKGKHLDRNVPFGYAYYRGVSSYYSGDYLESTEWLKKVPIDSGLYRRGKYLEGMAWLQLNEPEKSATAVQIALSLDPLPSEKELSKHALQKFRELAVLTLARLHYEGRNFNESLTYYRTLMQDSAFFRESLHEQGWAFFMAGYPNRALGASYAANSPFFADLFNPDSHMLAASALYWLCSFDHAETALSKYIEHTKSDGDLLKNYVQGSQDMALSDALRRNARLMLDLRQGVSSRYLGLGPKVLSLLKDRETLSDAALAAETATRDRLEMQRSSTWKSGKDRLVAAMMDGEDRFVQLLGLRVKGELEIMNFDFEKTLSQARLLHLEILTAKKDLLVKGSRSIVGSEYRGQELEFTDDTSRVAHNWKQDKNEFWYDEMGHYVFQLKSQCSNPAAR